MTRTELLAAVCLAASVMAACGGERGTAAGTDLASAPRWTAEEMIRVGSVDDPDQALTKVGDVVIGPDTELYVSQPGDGDIRVYDSDGHLIRTIGRKGEGPGEFSYMGYVGLKGDTLYATDYDLGRVSFSLWMVRCSIRSRRIRPRILDR